MAMGSYSLGGTVRIPLQVTDTGIAFTEDISPVIYKIVKPNGKSEAGFPKGMKTLDRDYATYYYDYKPDSVGDYVVIMAYYIEGIELTVIENFTVKYSQTSGVIPRGEAR